MVTAHPSKAPTSLALDLLFAEYGEAETSDFKGVDVPAGIQVEFVGPANDLLMRLAVLRGKLKEQRDAWVRAHRLGLDQPNGLRRAEAAYDMVHAWTRLEARLMYPQVPFDGRIVVTKKGEVGYVLDTEDEVVRVAVFVSPLDPDRG